MTAEELIMELEGMEPDTEVRFAGQPNWPFEYSISDIVYPEDDSQPAYLVEGEQLAYLDVNIKELIGW